MAGLRVRRGREFWQLVMQRQEESGISVAKFCEQEDLRAVSFYAWRKKLSGTGAATTASQRFAELVVGPSLRNVGLRIETRAGWSVCVDHHASGDLLRTIFQALREAGC